MQPQEHAVRQAVRGGVIGRIVDGDAPGIAPREQLVQRLAD
jgi:hypothetical protein